MYALQATVRCSAGFPLCNTRHEHNENWQIGGKTSELRRTGRRWRKPMAQFGEKVCFVSVKCGEDGVSSFASRTTQGIIVGHHDRTGAVFVHHHKWIVRGKRWTRQLLSYARDATKWDGPCGTPELKQDEESHIRQRRSSRVEIQGGWLALSLWASSKTRDGPFWSPLFGSECGLWEFVWEDQSAEWVRQVGPFFSVCVAFSVSQETAHFRFWES